MDAYVIDARRDHYHYGSNGSVWHGVEHLPNFYLLRRAQGILDENHAAQVAATLLGVPPENVTAYHTVL